MDPPAGFWQITPSDEFRSGGPLKQNLTSHVGPTTLAVSYPLFRSINVRGRDFSMVCTVQVFISGHYAGDDLNPKFGQGEPWKKVFGPVFIYVNSVMDGQDPLTLWDDAKRQVYMLQIVFEKLNIKLTVLTFIFRCRSRSKAGLTAFQNQKISKRQTRGVVSAVNYSLQTGNTPLLAYIDTYAYIYTSVCSINVYH